jgi:hypothetical protein
LIEAIERGNAKGAVRAAEDNFKETDVRVRLLLQNVAGAKAKR